MHPSTLGNFGVILPLEHHFIWGGGNRAHAPVHMSLQHVVLPHWV